MSEPTGFPASGRPTVAKACHRRVFEYAGVPHGPDGRADAEDMIDVIDVLDIGGVADAMDDRRWGLHRQQDGLHLMVRSRHVAHHTASRGRAATDGGAPSSP